MPVGVYNYIVIKYVIINYISKNTNYTIMDNYKIIYMYNYLIVYSSEYASIILANNQIDIGRAQE